MPFEAPSGRFELPLRASEARVLSIKLQGHFKSDSNIVILTANYKLTPHQSSKMILPVHLILTRYRLRLA